MKITIYCSGCGEPIPENATICSKCGKSTVIDSDEREKIKMKIKLTRLKHQYGLNHSLEELRGVPIFGCMGFLSIIGSIVSIVQFFIFISDGSGINWVLLFSTFLSLITAIAWFTIIKKFDVATEIIHDVIKLSNKTKENKSNTEQ